MSPTSQAMFSTIVSCWRRRVMTTRLGMIMTMMTVALLPMRTLSFFPAQSIAASSRRRLTPLTVAAASATTSDSTVENDDLTKEELGKRFSEARDYYRKTNEMTQEQVCLSFLRTRLQNLRLNRCFVATSTIPNAGRGLFASRDIIPGELITLYPGDALIVWNKTVGDFGQGDVGVMFGPHVQGVFRDAGRVSTNEARSFELKVGPRHSIVADPNLTDDVAYLGHMANDGAILMRRDNKSRELYSQQTVARHNAAFFVMEGCHFVTVATKAIRKDEEIFVSYGEGYWMSRSFLNKQGAAETNEGDTAGSPTEIDKTLMVAANNSKKRTKQGGKQTSAKSKTTKNGFGK